MKEPITVIIPTYNRPECIQYLLDYSLKQYHGHLFCFEVHDSSLNSKTRDLIEAFNEQPNSFKIKYFLYDSAIRVDIKVVNAIKKVVSDYFYIFGDGTFLDFNLLEKAILENLLNGFDILDIESVNRIGYLDQDSSFLPNSIKQEKDYVLFAKKYFSHLTYWGASIVRTKFFSYVFESNLIDKYLVFNLSWWLPCCLLDCMSYQNHKSLSSRLFVSYFSFISANPKKKAHSWTKGENYFVTTFYVLNRNLELLPPDYDGVKKEMVDFFRRDCLVNKNTLIQLRIEKTLQTRLVRKYKEDIDFIPGYFDLMLKYSKKPVFLLKFYCFVKRAAHKMIKLVKEGK